MSHPGIIETSVTTYQATCSACAHVETSNDWAILSRWHCATLESVADAEDRYRCAPEVLLVCPGCALKLNAVLYPFARRAPAPETL